MSTPPEMHLYFLFPGKALCPLWVGRYRKVSDEDWKGRVLRGTAGGTLEVWHREIIQESTWSASD